MPKGAAGTGLIVLLGVGVWVRASSSPLSPLPVAALLLLLPYAVLSGCASVDRSSTLPFVLAGICALAHVVLFEVATELTRSRGFRLEPLRDAGFALLVAFPALPVGVGVVATLRAHRRARRPAIDPRAFD